MVISGTRKACAITAVVRPPSSRSVRALPRPASRRSRSVARFLAVVMIQPAGLGGRPVEGQCRMARVKASWTASSAASKLSPGAG